jgi:hypothetical protein
MTVVERLLSSLIVPLKLVVSRMGSPNVLASSMVLMKKVMSRMTTPTRAGTGDGLTEGLGFGLASDGAATAEETAGDGLLTDEGEITGLDTRGEEIDGEMSREEIGSADDGTDGPGETIGDGTTEGLRTESEEIAEDTITEGLGEGLSGDDGGDDGEDGLDETLNTLDTEDTDESAAAGLDHGPRRRPVSSPP